MTSALVLSANHPISTLSCFQLSVVGLANTPAAMRKLAKSSLNCMPAVACCPLNVKFCTCEEQCPFAHCALPCSLMSCKFHRHTIAKRVLVYILFASFVRPFSVRMQSGKWPNVLQILCKRQVLLAKFTFFG